MSKRRLAAGIAILVLSLSSLHAQSAQTSRPTVGLALSGGGALGLAHIGVLRYFEEHRIPVDRIAGTSMGALLGGLYATGHDAGELESIVRNADWDDLLRVTPKFENRPVVEKQDWNRIAGQSTVRLGKRFGLPAGLNRGQSLTLLLSGETAAYSDIRNFDDLPIPFRCVAADLVSGKAFVIGEGLLPKAMRASMAIPGIFTPVDWDGRVLSDGGMVNNLPTDVARNMGADFVIAVTLRVSPGGAEDLYSIPSILRQAMNIAVTQNELRNMPLADIVVAVQLGTQGFLDFRDTAPLIQLGYDAAARQQAALDRLALTREQWDEYLRRRQSRERVAPDSGPLIETLSPQPRIQSSAASELMRKSGAMISRKQLEKDLHGLMAATGLPTAYYGWHRSAQGASGYQVILEARPQTEVVLRPSFFYQLSPDEPSRAALRLSTATILKNAYKSRLLADVTLGGDPGIRFEYYNPFGGTAYFIAPGFTIGRSHHYLYDGNSRTDRKRDRFAASLYFGLGTWRQLQLRLGTQAGVDRYGHIEPQTRFANSEIQGVINTQDSGQLPRKGFRLNAAGGWSFRKESYPYVRMDFDHFLPLGQQFSGFATGQIGSSLGRRINFFERYTAGGLTQLDVYRYQELRAETLVTGGVGVLYRGMNPAGSAFRPLIGSWYQAAALHSHDERDQSKHSGAVGIFLPTPLGLAGLTFSSDFHGASRFRLSIGSFWNRP